MAVDTLARAMIAEVKAQGGSSGPGGFVTHAEVNALLQNYVPLSEFNKLVATVTALQKTVNDITTDLNLGNKALYLVEQTSTTKMGDSNNADE